MIYNLIIITFFFNIIFLFFYQKIVRFINIYDKGDNLRKFQKEPVPPLGGLIIILNIILFIIIDYNFKINLFNKDLFNSNIEYLSFFLGCFAFYILGFYDDKYNLKAKIKLLASLILVLFFITLDSNLIIKNIRLNFLSNVFELNIFSYFFTLLCFLLFLNALNMFDGINLQVGSYVFFIFLFFIFKGILINFSIVMLISLIFFLILNFRNKIYMGNNGVFLLSFVISYIFIKSYNNNLKFYADEIFIIMLLPGIDMFRLFLLRIINGVNPFAPDTNHIHHLLRKRFNFTQTFIITQFLIIFFVIFYYYIDFRFLIFIFISLYSVLLFSITRK